MPSLAMVAWGLILVYVDFRIEVFDVVPDVLGWALVLVGLAPLTGRSGWFRVSVVAAWVGLAGSLLHVVSVPGVLGTLVEGVAETVVCVGICTAVIALVEDPEVRRRAGAIRAWSVGLAAVGLVLATVGDVEETGPLVPIAVVLVVVALVFMVVWLMFLFALAREETSPAPPLAVP